MSYINSTVYYTVTVGSAAFPSPLTISTNGAVEPTTVGATALYSGVAGNSVTNYGTLDGGAGEGKVDGGFGVDLSAGTLTNDQGAYINGGSGYYYGGDGVNLHGGTLTNYGTIDGGSVAHVFSSISGAGVDLSAGTLINNGAINAGSNTFYGAFAAYLSGGTLINNGSIGGAGGHYHYGGGVYLNGGALTTSGSISGGVSGGVQGNGGVAVQFGSAASTMTVDPGATFQGGISGFASGDTIDMTGLTPAQVASYFNPGTYTLTTADEGTLQFTERYIGQYFTFNADPSGTGTDITLATGSGISTILTSTVTLGSTYNPSPLTITATGGVYPFTGGATGVYSNISGNSLTNHGAIQGGTGYYGGGIGGEGVNFTKVGMLTNTGSITGGTGGGSNSGSGGQGGASVNLTRATLTNSGSITGGTGGAGVGGGAGGVGVALSITATLTNSGSITGGTGGGINPSYTGTGGQGGAGVYLDGRTLTTSGTISGGQGGLGTTVNGAAGDAVQFGSVASTLIVEPGAVFNGLVAADASVKDVLELSGTQAGGTPITLGTQFTGFSTLTFASGAQWTVDASTGAAPSSGLTINGFTMSDTIDVTNLTPTQVVADFNSVTHVITTAGDGTLHFTAISGDYFVFSSDGGTGTDITLATGPITTTLLYTVTLGSAGFPSPLTITNTGVVSPTVAGATGVFSNSLNNSLTNSGAIHGGAGSNSSVGGIGGVGVNFKAGTTLTNTSSITGGTGGSGSSTTGGAGGSGVNLLAGTLTNSGSITGGTGGAGTTTGGHGGAGVFLNGGMLITSGTISDGAGGTGTTTGAAGDAVQFGAVASTLIVDPNAVFNGEVVANANASVHDMLEFSGTQNAGTAITLGTQFINFSTLDFAAGAAWTADANVFDLTQHPLSIDGFGSNDTLDITNLKDTGVTTSFINDTLTITKGATTINLKFDSAFSGEHFVLTPNGNGTDVSLQSGAAATLAALGHDITNFVGDNHGALMSDRFTLSAHAFGSGPMLYTDPALVALGGHGFSANAFTDHGIAHASVMLK
jgi:hypothetical protein